MLNMVIPEEGVDQTPDGEFINLEFRHNDNGDYGNDIAFDMLLSSKRNS